MNTANIDLDNRRSLETLSGIIFDDKPSFLHLRGDSQERILDETNTRYSLDVIIGFIVNNFSGEEFNFYRKDYLYRYINNNLIKIQLINNYTL